MPILNGLKATEYIISFLGDRVKLPYLVLLTNGDTEKFGQKMLKSGFNRVLKKPIFKMGVQKLLIDAELLQIQT